MKMYMTRGINERVATDTKFAKFVTASLKKFLNNDWGVTCEEDAELNNAEPKWAMGAYEQDGEKIWIKRDDTYLTILFPSEY